MLEAVIWNVGLVEYCMNAYVVAGRCKYTTIERYALFFLVRSPRNPRRV